jgi:transposase-like protein
MARNYRKYDEDFKQGAVALVAETGKPIAQVVAPIPRDRRTLSMAIRSR